MLVRPIQFSFVGLYFFYRCCYLSLLALLDKLTAINELFNFLKTLISYHWMLMLNKTQRYSKRLKIVILISLKCLTHSIHVYYCVTYYMPIHCIQLDLDMRRRSVGSD